MQVQKTNYNPAFGSMMTFEPGLRKSLNFHNRKVLVNCAKSFENDGKNTIFMLGNEWRVLKNKDSSGIFKLPFKLVNCLHIKVSDTYSFLGETTNIGGKVKTTINVKNITEEAFRENVKSIKSLINTKKASFSIPFLHAN